MGHINEGDADLELDRLHLELHLLPKLEVKGAQRLVEEQDARSIDERPREGDSLALAT